jgi:hypothetical protein
MDAALLSLLGAYSGPTRAGPTRPLGSPWHLDSALTRTYSVVVGCVSAFLTVAYFHQPGPQAGDRLPRDKSAGPQAGDRLPRGKSVGPLAGDRLP